MSGMNWELARDRERARERSHEALTTWWWTPARIDNTCSQCGETTPRGQLAAWSPSLQMMLCQVCAEPHSPQMSKAATRAAAQAQADAAKAARRAARRARRQRQRKS